MSINLDKAVWNCFTGCGGGTLRDLLCKISGKNRLEIDSEIYRLLDEEDLKLICESNAFVEENLPLIEVEFPFDKSKVPPWIFDRGFTKQSLKRWGCGYDHRTGSLAIPILDSVRRSVGWVIRQPADRQPKYVYSTGLHTSKLLFGQYNIKATASAFLCITEGTLDTIWLDQHQFSSIALLGLNLSRFQEDLIKNMELSEIVLCLDNDPPGQQATDKIYRRLSKYFPTSIITIPPQFKDVQDIRDSETLKNIIANRSVFR